MSQGKVHLYRMAEIMFRKGIQHVVVSPGSRNAPAIIQFSRHGQLKLTSIVDERSAGFYALGMAIELKQTVALLCTSGSAAINYGPAIAEAYYQKVPLLVITADRPVAWIDQGDGQTIRQPHLFANYVHKSFQIPEHLNTQTDLWYFDRTMNEAIDRTHTPVMGPVHVNIPLDEPLYELEVPGEMPELRLIELAGTTPSIAPERMKALAETWNASPRKMILVGQMSPKPNLEEALRRLSDDPSVIVLTETTSNMSSTFWVGCIDRVIEGLTAQDTNFAPEMLLTFGDAIVSKKIKALLRQMKPRHHWHVSSDASEYYLDTYQSLTLTLPVDSLSFIPTLARLARPLDSDYRSLWQQRNLERKLKHQQYYSTIPYSDFRVFGLLIQHLPPDSQVHLANSTPVRYAQLFDYEQPLVFRSNRGTSGIDGCVSTAAGAAAVNPAIATVITGDIGFLYDSNALWNNQLAPNLRIVVINNRGGNIFRVLPGPDKYAEMEPYLETAHSYSARGIALSFGVPYFTASGEEELLKVIPEFYATTGKPGLLEIFTPAALSAEVLLNYFKFLKA